MNKMSRFAAALAYALLMSVSVNSASLWNESTTGFYTTKKSYQVGDIVTVLVEESTRADNNWKQERDKGLDIEGTAAAAGLGAGNKNLLGRFFPFMDMEYKSEYKTDNKSDRQSSVSTTIAAEIVNVLPNGNLQIIARKTTRVNAEEQVVELTGNIRPVDITPQNVVSSSRIADATIRVNGQLRYADSQKPGLIERIVSFIAGIFL